MHSAYGISPSGIIGVPLASCYGQRAGSSSDYPRGNCKHRVVESEVSTDKNPGNDDDDPGCMEDRIVDLIPVTTVLTMISSYKHNLFRYNFRNMFSGLRLI